MKRLGGGPHDQSKHRHEALRRVLRPYRLFARCQMPAGLRKVLIISYHALPMDVVASYRTKAYCDYFYENGLFPTLVTHRWEREGGSWAFHSKSDEIKYEKQDTYEIFRLARPMIRRSSGTALGKVRTAWHVLRGDLDAELTGSYKVFKTFLFQHLAANKYDVVLGIFSPHFSLKLAYEIGRAFDIPYVLDFRDLWDNQLVTNQYRPSLRQYFFNFFVKSYWRKWLRQSLFFSTTGRDWVAYLERLSGRQGIIVRNGYDEISIAPIRVAKPAKRFVVTYFGRLYQNQRLDVIAKGIRDFIAEEMPGDDFVIQLIGIKKPGNFDGVNELLKQIPREYVEVLGYMPKEQLMAYCSENSSLFLLPNFAENNGQFMVKSYDYISLRKPVIVAPSNGSETELLVHDLDAGLVTSSAEEVAAFIKTCYGHFKTGKPVELNYSADHFEFYSRGNQAKIMAQHIKEALLKL